MAIDEARITEEMLHKAHASFMRSMKERQRQGRGTKHPRGATKQTVAARKAKNRKKRKAGR